jgi:hypothetical protein
MQKPVKQMIMAALLLGACFAVAEEPALVPMENSPLRLSAIVSSGTRFYGGFVDAETGQAHLVPEGGKVMHWRVTAIDEVAMTALLEDSDGDKMLLALTGDEALAAEVLAGQQAPSIKTLEEFLAEHPELAAAAAEQVPVEFPAVTNGVATFEDFLAAHPQWAGVSNYVAPELLDSNAVPPATLSGAEVESEPVSREEGLRRMAEQTGQSIPEDKETTFEEFLQQHAPAPEQPMVSP